MHHKSDIKNILKKIGLNPSDVDIYFLCMEYGSLSISTISRLLNIPRTTINDRVEKLIRDGILIAQKSTKGSRYHCANAQELINLFYRKNENNLDIITAIQSKQELRNTYDRVYNKLPKIMFYEGGDVHKNFAFKMKSIKEAAFITDVDATLKYRHISVKELVKEYYLGKAKHIREIVFDTKQGKEYSALMKKKGYLVKLLNTKGKKGINSDIALIKDYYYHITYGEVISGFEIYNPVFYEINMLLFDTLRESLP